ncbi:MAG TPA: hypothetical protein VM097_03745 [Mycobacteriales bacterium]|nr:hypothetical protein [Mycobacteriales bacterium]
MPVLRAAAAALVLTLVSGCAEGDPSPVQTPTPFASAPASATPTTAPTSTLPAGVDQLVSVEVRDGEIVGGARRVRVRTGSVVRLVVTSDVADEIHLHTYDKTVDVEAGGRSVLTFTASIPGVITAELESRHLTLVRFQVQ